MENNYYQVDYANEVTRLNVEKQQLISFLEDKIKEYENKRDAYCEVLKEYDLILDVIEVLYKLKAYQEVLDFVNKGGK